MFLSLRVVAAIAGSFVFSNVLHGQSVAVSDFASMGRSVHRSKITEYNGAIYLNVGVDDTHQRELWAFDGTSLDQVSGRFVGDTETSIDDFTVFQGDLYFSANDGQYGRELFRYDGNRVTLAADLEVGATSSDPVGLFVHNNELFFSARSGESFNSLWKFDGSNATKVVQFDDPRASVVTGATYQGEMYFGADDGKTGMELWKYDGNEVAPVADVNVGTADSFPRDFVVLDDTLYFKATTSEAGQEIWSYDGQQVSLVNDANPGRLSSDPRGLIERNGNLYYSAVAYGDRFVFEYDGTNTRKIANGGGPIDVNGELMMFQGERIDGVEIQTLYKITDDRDGEFYRSLVPSAGPFAELDENLFFTCECDARELYMAVPAGDANSDGAVSYTDFLSLSLNFGKHGDWPAGDFDSNGKVEFPDLLMLSKNYGKEVNIEKGVTSASIPEPSSQPITLLVAMACCTIRRRRVR